jgi:hypothetical protein
MTDQRFKTDISIGATDELSLRVSVATLIRVLFEHPKDGEVRLALERRATLHDAALRRAVEVKSQPFGGAIRIHDPGPLQSLIGNFHFDSEESRAVQDFRILIRPSTWKAVRQFCIRHFNIADDSVLETDARRELEEEFTETMGISLKPEQYTCQAVGTVIEDRPTPTANFYARDFPTVRIYRIFQARILDDSLAGALVMNSESHSNDHLRERALQDARHHGNGWANAVLTLPLRPISAFYEATSPDARNRPVVFQGHLLDETVAALLENVTVPKYQREFS